MENIHSIIENYCYLDQNTYHKINDIISYVAKNIDHLLDDTQNQTPLQKTIDLGLVCVLHLIWTQNNPMELKKAETILVEIYQIANNAITNYFMAKLKHAQGDLEKALDYYQIANSLNKKEKITAKYQIKNILLAMGSLTNNDKFISSNDVLSAVIFNDAANVYIELNQFDLALEYFDCAYAIQLQIYLSDHNPNIAYTLRNMARAYLGKNDLTKARLIADKAYTMSENIYDKNHPEIKAIELVRQQIKANSEANTKILSFSYSD